MIKLSIFLLYFVILGKNASIPLSSFFIHPLKVMFGYHRNYRNYKGTMRSEVPYHLLLFRVLVIGGFLTLSISVVLPSSSLLIIQSAFGTFQKENGKIAFTSFMDGNNEIYVMNADGSEQTRLTNNTTSDSEPSWSPDGTKIAFIGERDGRIEIYVMNADGSEQTRLTNTADPGVVEQFPSWSPDGTKIAFISSRDGNREIYVMNADGSNSRRLTNHSAYDSEPSWSPDGTKIAFISSRDGNREIYVMNADGSEQTRLTTMIPGRTGYSPDWSPDGTKIAFESNRDGNNEIYVMNADGSEQTRLTNNTANNSQPDWGPNGGPLQPDTLTAEIGSNATQADAAEAIDELEFFFSTT